MTQPDRPGLLRRIWRTLSTPTAAFSLGALLFVGFIAGIVFWGGFNWGMEMTNKETFCISCHEMKDNVYAEYQGTIHQNNRSGVRATCPDCHVPKDWIHKVVRKIQASKEVYHHLTGYISTPEKFAEHRPVMAANVWRTMKRTDSRECRNCHKFNYMDFTMQANRAAAEHQRGQDEGKTCIDCHQGIAHSLPQNYLEIYRGVAAEFDAKP